VRSSRRCSKNSFRNSSGHGITGSGHRHYEKRRWKFLKDQLWLFSLPASEAPKHSGDFFEGITAALLGARRNPSETANNGDLFLPELSARIEVKSGCRRVPIRGGQLDYYLHELVDDYSLCLYAACFYRPLGVSHEVRQLKDARSDRELQLFLSRSFCSLYLVDASVLMKMGLREKIEPGRWHSGAGLFYLKRSFESALKSSIETERLLSSLALDPESFARGHGFCAMPFRGHNVRFLFHFLLPRSVMLPFAALIVRREREGKFTLARDFRNEFFTAASE